jgi:hypothetical protein
MKKLAIAIATCLSAFATALVSAQFTLPKIGTSVNIDKSGVSVNAAGVTVNSSDLKAAAKKANRNVASTDGKCVDGTLSIKTSGVGDQKLGDLACNLVVVDNNAIGDLMIASVKAKEFVLTLSGTGNIVIDGGTVESADYLISGTGDLKAANLKAVGAVISIEGTGNADINAVKTLNTATAGTGDVRYNGSPSVSSNTTGKGNVSRM